MKTTIISAVCTPLQADDSLHVEGLHRHLDDQWRHGISGVLVGGTMGLMQLLPDATYRELIREAAKVCAGRGETLICVGDTSLARTRQRIEYAEQFDIDGIVVLAPFFFPLGQADLVRYYTMLADAARKPLYLYDLPGLTKTKLEMDTVLQLSKHPNIRGIKCSCEWTWTRRLMDRVGEDFRVVPAQAEIVDLLIRCGVPSNLDGIFSVVPHLIERIVAAAEGGNYMLATTEQGKMTSLLELVRGGYPLFPACTALLNARGIPGRVHPLPTPALDAAQLQQFLNEPLVQELIEPALI
jgi:4-hydroxy-tetrahydrodipicolinate synthase